VGRGILADRASGPQLPRLAVEKRADACREALQY